MLKALKFFLINIVVLLVLAFAGIYITLLCLDSYTMHDEYIKVPAFHGFSQLKSEDIADLSSLRIDITDSVYDPSTLAGHVVEQYPIAGSKVKKNRLIHLIINTSEPEKSKVPDLKNISYRQTVQTLQGLGFIIGSINYEKSQYQNLVLKTTYKGEEIIPGTKLPKGSVIDITLGDGYRNEEIITPDLIGKTYKEAHHILISTYLNAGIEKDDTFSNNINLNSSYVYVYSQNPLSDKKIKNGSFVVLKITTDESKAVSAIIANEIRIEEKEEFKDFFKSINRIEDDQNTDI